MLTCFYGFSETEKRFMGFELLRYLSIVHHCPWLVIGDFNEFLYHHEKFGGAKRRNRQMNLFQDVLQDCILSDLGFSRGKYTWSHNRLDWTLQRIN